MGVSYKDYDRMLLSQFFSFPRQMLGVSTEYFLFERIKTSGIIQQVTFEVRAGNNSDWKNTIFNFYVGDQNNKDEVDFKISSDDIVNGLAYIYTNIHFIDATVYYYSYSRRSKVSILLNMDFINSLKISVIPANTNVYVGFWMLYKVYYYNRGEIII